MHHSYFYDFFVTPFFPVKSHRHGNKYHKCLSHENMKIIFLTFIKMCVCKTLLIVKNKNLNGRNTCPKKRYLRISQYKCLQQYLITLLGISTINFVFIYYPAKVIMSKCFMPPILPHSTLQIIKLLTTLTITTFFNFKKYDSIRTGTNPFYR